MTFTLHLAGIGIKHQHGAVFRKKNHQVSEYVAAKVCALL